MAEGVGTMTTPTTLTRPEAAHLLREWIRDWRISPHTAGLIYGELPDEGIDTETLGDWLDGQGHPELAEAAYALGKEAA